MASKMRDIAVAGPKRGPAGPTPTVQPNGQHAPPTPATGRRLELDTGPDLLEVLISESAPDSRDAPAPRLPAASGDEGREAGPASLPTNPDPAPAPPPARPLWHRALPALGVAGAVILAAAGAVMAGRRLSLGGSGGAPEPAAGDDFEAEWEAWLRGHDIDD